MIKALTYALVLGTVLSTSAICSAASPAAVKKVKQEVRIHEGVKTGQLTKREAAALRAEQVHIRTTRHAMKADGRIDRVEHRKLARMQARASHHIAAAKHNRRHR